MSVRVMSLVFGSDLPPIDRLVALALADHAHDDGTRVWPSIPNLAAKVGLGTTATRSAVRRLEAGGVLEAVRSDPGKVREYRFIPGWLIAQLTPTYGVGVVETNTPTAETTDPDASRGGPQRIGVAEPSTTEPSTTEPPRANARAREAVPVIPSAFAAFWGVYPRHSGTGAARKAFATALQRATAAEIIAGAVRLRDDPNREPAYTPHASTWLNQDRWLDEGLPPRHAPPRDRATELMVEALQEGYGNGQHAGEGDPGNGNGVLPDTRALPGDRAGMG